MATIRSDKFLPQMATVRPGVMKPVHPRRAASGRLITEASLPSDKTGLKTILENFGAAGDAVERFGHASFIIAGGRGMNGADGFKMLEDFASLAGGAVGATRAAVDAGWASYGMQIGQTGRTVQPRIYMACAISGQIQHLVGMQSSDLVIAINKDREAPIMKMADIAVVGDALEIVPAMAKQIRSDVPSSLKNNQEKESQIWISKDCPSSAKG